MPQLPQRFGAVRPYAYNIFLLGLIPVALVLDVHTQNLWEQDVLGFLALCVLVFCTRFSSPTERRQVWIMVGVATCVELWSSVVWGIYRYRFGNLPLFVPWGHGLVYLFALCSARTPFMLRHGKLVSKLALGAATAWMAYGLTIEPLVLGRLDVTGAAFFPIFVWFMRKPRAPIDAAAVFVTSYRELIGTNLGNWTWQLYAPVSHIPTGNPPSVIAAGYCIMDFTSLALSARLGAPGVLERTLARLGVALNRGEGAPVLAEAPVESEITAP